jgi:hypothetical protein
MSGWNPKKNKVLKTRFQFLCSFDSDLHSSILLSETPKTKQWVASSAKTPRPRPVEPLGGDPLALLLFAIPN